MNAIAYRNSQECNKTVFKKDRLMVVSEPTPHPYNGAVHMIIEQMRQPFCASVAGVGGRCGYGCECEHVSGGCSEWRVWVCEWRVWWGQIEARQKHE